MSERKLRVKGTGQISIPVPNFVIVPDFGVYSTQDGDGNDLNWGVEIKPITNFTVLTTSNDFTFGSPVVDFTQATSNNIYDIISSENNVGISTLFNVGEYYKFTTILEEPGKDRDAIFEGRPLSSYVFQYNGTISNRGGSYFLEFTYFTWSAIESQWYESDVATTEVESTFAFFGGSELGGGGEKGGL